MNRLDFILKGKEQAVIECTKWGSGLVVGKQYKTWLSKGKFYKIINSSCNEVKVSKKYFEVVSRGDVIK
tara:strand:+ start:83 stop:289 length:207 start_codon:yes stop_codon:yes gene_type:complete